MAELGVWIAFVLNIVFLLVAGHIALTMLLPKLRTILVGAVGKEELVNAVIYLFVVYIIIFVVKKLVDIVVAVGNSFLNLIAMLNPGLEILILLLTYLQWIVLGAVLVIGLKGVKK